MISGSATSYVNDPVFQDALVSFQNGDWDQGFDKLDSLVEQYPAMTQLRDFRQEMLMRSRMDEYERIETKQEITKKIIYWGARTAAVAVILILFAWGVNSYSAMLQTQWNNIQQAVLHEGENLVLTMKFRDAQNYMGAGRPEDALLLLDEIVGQDPNYPGLAELQIEANQQIEFERQYQTAADLLESGDAVAALAAFQVLQEEQPGYKDVPLLIQEIESTLILNDLFSQAEEAFADEDWEGAILRYESLRAEAPKYKPEQVEERLINSYISTAVLALDDETPSSENLLAADRNFRKALMIRPRDPDILAVQDQAMAAFKERLFQSYLEKARETLVDNEDSLEALKVANSYYDLALEIKPDDPDVKLERQLTNAYLKAQNSFLGNEWDVVIDNLEYVVERDKDYANGTASQTLYEAYMQRGKKLITSGEYGGAIEDFQRAAEIADNTPEAIIQVYWSLIEMADVYGILGEYEKADSLYSHAVEWIGLRDILQDEHSDLVVLLDEADRYAGIEWFRTSYRLYNRVLPAGDLIYSAVYHEVSEGDYLTQIASQYRTTVEAILTANELASPGDIKIGQRIIIPVLSGDEQ